MATTLTQSQTKPKRASDEYVDFRKKISDKNKLKVIEELKKEWCLTSEEVCQRILFDGIAEHKKRMNL